MAEKFYYPLDIWARKVRSRTEAAKIIQGNPHLYAWQWVGIGSFVSEDKPPHRRDIQRLVINNLDAKYWNSDRKEAL